MTIWGAVVAIGLWLAGAAIVAVAGWRSGSSTAAAAGIATVVALVAGLAGASLIPVSMFGLVPQNYYWVWSIGAFASIALIAGAATLPDLATRIRSVTGRFRTVLAWGLLAGACSVASWPRYPVASVAFDEDEADRIGRPMRAELAGVFSAPSFPRAVEVDLTRAYFGYANYPYVLLTELQRAGIDFRFPAGTLNLHRFGDSRSAAAGNHPRVALIIGRDPPLEPGSRVLLRLAAITDDELVELAALDERFGDLLRAGTVRVDVDDVVEPVSRLEQVLSTPGQPATGLARSLDSWRLPRLRRHARGRAQQPRPLGGPRTPGGERLPDDRARATRRVGRSRADVFDRRRRRDLLIAFGPWHP